eukprot:TRINITY_DN5984_c0_g3_i1.p1 TRINITY_DN5984_c0_g3~~TRINITY_DN5984_c0_g3_i1.p1  ORF type:complete len:704 (+),score=123.98 TRINITY_DN5984_c0_g3_i1:51-2162(+)
MKSFVFLAWLRLDALQARAATSAIELDGDALPPTTLAEREACLLQLDGIGIEAFASTTSSANGSVAGSDGRCASLWSECGHDYPPCCGGSACEMQDTWYSQCRPTAANVSAFSSSLPGGGGVFSQGCCAFATSYMCADWRSKDVQKAYISDALAAERGFFAAPGVSYDPDTGLSQDGSKFDMYSGAVDAHHGLRFSAPSKEMIQISLLSLSLAKEDTGLVAYTQEEALNLLEKKVKMFEDFDASFPAFGGYLPWFCSRGSKNNSDGKPMCRNEQDPPGPLAPTPDWTHSLPSLDNGQLAWAAYSAANTLSDLAAKEHGEQQTHIADLAQRWQKRVDRMKSTAVPLFYNGNGSGNVRIIAHLRNLSQDAANSPNNSFTMDHMVLNGPFEDELMVVWMTLLADWSGYPNNGAEEKKLIWADKRRHLFAVNYTTKQGENITVQQGFRASAHEQWKLLVLPYLDIPLVKQVFVNTERARLINSIEKDFPGLFASSHAPSDAHCSKESDYCSDEGVGEMSQIPVEWTVDKLSVTPYAAFPSIVIDPGAGLAWYNTMLRLPHMQTTAGSVESSDLQGKQVAAFLTWDAKATTVLAMLGGTGPRMRHFLERDGVLQQFNDYVGEMYRSKFAGKKLRAYAWSEADAVSSDNLPLPPISIVGKALELLAMTHRPYSPYSGKHEPEHFATCRCQGGQVPPAVARSPSPGCSSR